MALILDTLELDDQFEWIDEFAWDAVEQGQERTLTGALVVQEGLKLYGRPITLAANGGVWTPLSVVRQLEALRDQRGLVMPLTLPGGATHSVIFNRASGQALEAKPIERLVEPGPDELYEITLRLITVAPPAP